MLNCQRAILLKRVDQAFADSELVFVFRKRGQHELNLVAQVIDWKGLESARHMFIIPLGANKLNDCELVLLQICKHHINEVTIFECLDQFITDSLLVFVSCQGCLL